VKYWLIKSEPASYSWNQMMQDKVVHWDGVRNYQARNNMRKMKLGDLTFFYHSNKDKAVMGIIKVLREYYPDHTDPTGKFDMVDFEYVEALPRPVTLHEIRSHPKLQNTALIKQSRLSVMPILKEEYNTIHLLIHSMKAVILLLHCLRIFI
jgi:predicted RNA-binding protein with PUA-like domain